MSLETQLAEALTREQYVAVLNITLTELATALCRLADDEKLRKPFRITFKDQSRWRPHVAELCINDTMAWTKRAGSGPFELAHFRAASRAQMGARSRWGRSNSDCRGSLLPTLS